MIKVPYIRWGNRFIDSIIRSHIILHGVRELISELSNVNSKNLFRVILSLLLLTFFIICFYPKSMTFALPFKGSFIGDKPLYGHNVHVVRPWAKIKLVPFVSEFYRPVYFTHANDKSGRVFIVGRKGRVYIVKHREVILEPFLDITYKVGSRAYEQGLFSIAFHPNYKKNGRFFVNYNDLKGNTVVAEYKANPRVDVAERNSERVILYVQQPTAKHNGGQLKFGPDGYLYIGMGDGGSLGGGDPSGNVQNLKVLLGKMLRIDVDGKTPYELPESNPFVIGRVGLKEIWASGLRNPWRFSFDRKTGDLYISDVGKNRWEEINFQSAKSKGGENYGWNIMEGFHSFEFDEDTDINSLAMPLIEYGHDQGCSVTGGYVYRGKRFPSIYGTYFFSDFCSGIIWGLRRTTDGIWETTEYLNSSMDISSFGEDEEGEIYVLDYRNGDIHHLTVDEQ